MGCGASVAAYLQSGMDDSVTSVGSAISMSVTSEISSNVPVRDWLGLEMPMTPKHAKRVEALNLQISEAQRAWLESVR